MKNTRYTSISKRTSRSDLKSAIIAGGIGAGFGLLFASYWKRWETGFTYTDDSAVTVANEVTDMSLIAGAITTAPEPITTIVRDPVLKYRSAADLFTHKKRVRSRSINII